jgi:hypothetical protein
VVLILYINGAVQNITQNRVYSRSIPSLLRKLSLFQTVDEIELYKLISNMRIAEFRSLLLQFEHIKDWELNYGTVLFDSIAQHYGIETQWLDVTNDFEVALFFATSYYDSNDNKYKPLTRDMIEQSEDTRFGMIFHAPNWAVHANNSFENVTSADGSKVNRN